MCNLPSVLYLTISCTNIAVAIFFNKLTYIVNEDIGSVEVTLVLSNPSSTDITLQIIDTGDTATGE